MEKVPWSPGPPIAVLARWGGELFGMICVDLHSFAAVILPARETRMRFTVGAGIFRFEVLFVGGRLFGL